jgi:hypothetical protein
MTPLFVVALLILALQLGLRLLSRSRSFAALRGVDEQQSVHDAVSSFVLRERLERAEAELASLKRDVSVLRLQVANRDESLLACDRRLEFARSSNAAGTGGKQLLADAMQSIAVRPDDRGRNRKRCRSVDDDVLCVQRAPTLVIVMPFPPKQLNFVQDNLRAWQSFEFYPCDPARQYGANVELMLFLSQPDRAVQQTLVKQFWNTTWARECFSSLSFKFIDMDEKTDVYGPGTLAMFYSSFDDDFFHKPRDYMLWCEPDFVPIRRHWLDMLYERELCGVPEFWMRGSIPRYPNSEGDWHLNGNALYNVGNRTFAAFAKSSRGAFKPYDSFDQSLFVKFGEHREYAHLFVYTDAIQNRGYEIYDIPTLRASEPNLLIAHGKGLLQSVKLFYEGAAPQQ